MSAANRGRLFRGIAMVISGLCKENKHTSYPFMSRLDLLMSPQKLHDVR